MPLLYQILNLIVNIYLVKPDPIYLRFSVFAFFRLVLQNGLTTLRFKVILKILKPEDSRKGN